MAYQRKRGAYQRTRRGNFINAKGVVISQEERKEFNYLVRKANAKRNKIISSYSPKRLKELDNLENADAKSGDFMLSKKSSNLDRFKNKKQFDVYKKYLRKISSQHYQNRLYRTYRGNLMQSLRTKFGSQGDDLAKELDGLTDKEIRDITLGDKLHDVGWLYREQISDNAKFKTIQEEIKRIKQERV